jgi:uncharacterized protein YggE
LIRPFWLPGLLTFGLLSPLNAAEPFPRTISVSGQGTATAPPDMATIRTGIVTQADTAAAALESNTRAMQQIISVLKEQQIAAKDIQTSQFDVRPEYRRGPRGQQQPEISGYRVTNQVRVRVRNLPQLGDILDALVSAGSNQISGIVFDLDDPTGVLNQARTRAVADARSRAALYAQAAGVQLGKLLTISEQPVARPLPRVMPQAMMAEAAGVPVETGEQELRATIHLVYAVDDRD